MTSFGKAPPYTPEEFAKLQEHWAEYLTAVTNEAWMLDFNATKELRNAQSQVINEHVVARLMSTIERLRAAEARTAWQPIETAPPDEWVLVWDVQIRMAGKRDGRWRDGSWTQCHPTHWQPLPEPPR